MNSLLLLYFNGGPLNIESRTDDRFTTYEQRFSVPGEDFYISGIVRFTFSLKNLEASDISIKVEFNEIENISICNAKEHLKSLLKVRYSL